MFIHPPNDLHNPTKTFSTTVQNKTLSANTSGGSNLPDLRIYSSLILIRNLNGKQGLYFVEMRNTYGTLGIRFVIKSPRHRPN